MDDAALRALLDQIHFALNHPPSIRPSFGPLSEDTSRLAESVLEVANAARAAAMQESVAPSAQGQPPARDAEHELRVAGLINELTDLWRIRATMALGYRKARRLHTLLGEPCVDLLGILRREDDENMHSDVLRWLLDPREAPNVAPAALRALAARVPNAEPLRAAVDNGLKLGCIRVRREVVVGHDLSEDHNRNRIDIVVSSPDFVIGIENKVKAVEHDMQTRTYQRWLERLPGLAVSRVGFFLTPNGTPAAAPQFTPLSYLELASYLLEASTRRTLDGNEHQVLAGYMKTLASRVLRAEFNAISSMGAPP